MSDKQICPECGAEMVFAGMIEYGGLGMPHRPVKGYKCVIKGCAGNPDQEEK